jgi:Fe-S-cluster containining protein
MQRIEFKSIEEAKKIKFPDASGDAVRKFREVAEFVTLGNASRNAKVKAIYEAADAITVEVAPLTACQKGCNHCCKIDVGVAEVEAQFIGRNIGKSPRIVSGATEGYGENRTPCTFLSQDGSCKIYQYRPFACRTYFALDSPDYCKDLKVSHVTYDYKGNGMLTKLAHLLSQLNGAGRGADIRDFFPL